MSTVKLKLKGAIVVGGEVIRPPQIVEVSEAEAKNLLHRGKAVPATEDDEPNSITPSAEVSGSNRAERLAAAQAELDAARAEAAITEGKKKAQKDADAKRVAAAEAAVAELTN